MTNEELKSITKPKECYPCILLKELFEQAELTNRNYYVVTELFVLLHNGDVCRNT